MDLKLFEQSPHVASLLVRLYDSQRLYGLARDNAPEARMELSAVMANLLEYPLESREQELVADVLITLIRNAESDLRRMLAERLSKMANVPLRLVLHLVNDDIQVAGPMLRESPVLSDLDLIYIIKLQGPAYWQAIAARHSLNDQIIDALAGTKDVGTALVLTQNERVHLTAYALETLTTLAVDHTDLARPLLMREDMPSSMARRLYGHVGAELKNYIKAFYGIIPNDVEDAVDDVILDFIERAPIAPPVPAKPAAPVAAADDVLPTEESMGRFRLMMEGGKINLGSIVDAVRKGELQTFIGLLAAYTAMSPRYILSMMKQTSGRHLAILCRAYGMQKGDFSTIYLMCHRLRSSGRLVNHNDLLAALSYFDKVRPETARTIMARSIKATTRH